MSSPLYNKIVARKCQTSIYWAVKDEIRYRAETGKYIIRGFGYSGKLPDFDDLLLIPVHGLGTPSPIDQYRERVDTSVVIGKGMVKRPLRLSTPIMIGAMSYGATSREFKLACAKAVNIVGTATNTGEGGQVVEKQSDGSIRWLEFEYTKPNGYLIVQFASGRWGVSLEYLLNSDAIEIKYGQGAKPGFGGHLLGEKVVDEIAYTRGIPKGTDCLSPARHLDIRSLDDLRKVIKILRDIVGYEKPIGIKIGPGNVYKEVYAATQCDIDFIAVDGKYGGTGASPQHAIQGLGLPTLACIPAAVRALKDAGVREEVALIALGGFRDGVDAAKALALGADAVALASAIMIAAGCMMCGQCSTGKCPAGICTQDPELRKRIGGGKGIDEATKWIANYMKAVTKEVAQLAAACGHRSVREFNKEDLRAITVEAAAIAGVKLAGLEDYVLPQWRWF
ncbi:MAG: FMN-binding glutamate synthase family protein [Thermoprotei archaeon]|nr:MAG: FMN-binding glutamate synthase family protein [Thermoprotei archaeon]